MEAERIQKNIMNATPERISSNDKNRSRWEDAFRKNDNHLLMIRNWRLLADRK
jgi:hypothetical protein